MHKISLDLASIAGQEAETILPASRKAAESFAALFSVVARLRAPDGCPWDREQTHASLGRHLIEETYETIEAIDGVDVEAGTGFEHLEEELGDLLFSAVNAARFLRADPEEALTKATDKFIFRFANVEALALEQGKELENMTLAELDKLWDEAKKR